MRTGRAASGGPPRPEPFDPIARIYAIIARASFRTPKASTI